MTKSIQFIGYIQNFCFRDFCLGLGFTPISIETTSSISNSDIGGTSAEGTGFRWSFAISIRFLTLRSRCNRSSGPSTNSSYLNRLPNKARIVLSTWFIGPIGEHSAWHRIHLHTCSSALGSFCGRRHSSRASGMIEMILLRWYVPDLIHTRLENASQVRTCKLVVQYPGMLYRLCIDGISWANFTSIWR